MPNFDVDSITAISNISSSRENNQLTNVIQ
ncbi:unnamed protein product, partial [Rotaria sordida]